VYGNPFRGTVSRMYVWRSISNPGITGDSFLDRYFFRVSIPSNNPTCIDGVIEPSVLTLPCRFCIVGFNPPTDLFATVPLYCLSEEKPYRTMFIAFWNFDEKTADIQK
jgi:hypothetical protein